MKKSRKQVWIIGCGFGGRRLITRQESAALKASQLYIGSGEAMKLAEEYAAQDGGRCVYTEKPAQIRKIVAEAKEERIAVLTQEDPATSGELSPLLQVLSEYRPYVFPGVSVVSYVTSRAGISGADAVCVDLRKGDRGLIPVCRRHRKIVVTGDAGMSRELKALMEAGFRDMRVFILEHPACDDERVITGRLFEIAGQEISEDAVYLFLRPNAAGGSPSRNREYLGSELTALPMEARSVVLSYMALTPEDTVYVIGAGCGDAAIEASAHAHRGTVYAIEADKASLMFLRKNCERHGAGNVRIVVGEAPGALGHLPPADVVLIRGCPESVVDLIQISMSRNPDVRIVVITDAIEKAAAAAAQMEAKRLDMEFLQMNVSRGVRKDRGHAMKAGDTYFILSGMKKTEGVG